jgi:hypothetical protein
MLLAVGFIGYRVAWPFVVYFRFGISQFNAGKAELDSLTPEKLKVWAARSEELWAKHGKADYDVGVYGLGRRPIPRELAEIKIIRIDIGEDLIEYVWVGGMDHTSLIVEKGSDGLLSFTAQYDDDRRKKLGIIPIGNHSSNYLAEPASGGLVSPAAGK